MWDLEHETTLHIAVQNLAHLIFSPKVSHATFKFNDLQVACSRRSEIGRKLRRQRIRKARSLFLFFIFLFFFSCLRC